MAYGSSPYEVDECQCHDSDSHCQNQQVGLSCGNGNGLILPIGGGCEGPSSNRWQPPALVVSTVNLDTSDRIKPTIKIDFSSLISFKAISNGGRYFLGIIFQLSRVSNSGAKIPLSTWIFEKKVDGAVDCHVCCCDNNDPARVPNPAQVGNSGDFTFSWCECDACPGCYTYLLEVIDFESAFIEFAAITNVSISAMVG